MTEKKPTLDYARPMPWERPLWLGCLVTVAIYIGGVFAFLGLVAVIFWRIHRFRFPGWL